MVLLHPGLAFKFFFLNIHCFFSHWFMHIYLCLSIEFLITDESIVKNKTKKRDSSKFGQQNIEWNWRAADFTTNTMWLRFRSCGVTGLFTDCVHLFCVTHALLFMYLFTRLLICLLRVIFLYLFIFCSAIFLCLYLFILSIYVYLYFCIFFSFLCFFVFCLLLEEPPVTLSHNRLALNRY